MRYNAYYQLGSRGVFLFMGTPRMKQFGQLVAMVAMIVAVWWVVDVAAPFVGPIVAANPERELVEHMLAPAILLLIGFVCHYLSHRSPVPSFVLAIGLGLACRPLLEPFIHNELNLKMAVTAAATLILFQGGLETSFRNFRKLFPKIFLLAFPGVLLTGFLLSNAILMGARWLGVEVTVPVALLLGAILASTDPAAIIPLLQGVKFRNQDTKDIAVSESALNDVVGALLTTVFLGIVMAGGAVDSIQTAYQGLVSVEQLQFLAEQFVIGTAWGVVGYVLIRLLARHKRSHEQTYAVDTALFSSIPIVVFGLALLFHGSGYLAAFVAGLLAHMEPHLEKIEEFFNDTIDGFAKPIIFGLLGSLVELDGLLQYASIGLAAAAVFILVIRPLMVFSMLGGFGALRKMTFGQLAFLSSVRETGAIPAVLLISVSALNVPNAPMIVAIGMWVILCTLIVLPVLTPRFARLTGVAEPA